jgi:hypothetical protein
VKEFIPKATKADSVSFYSHRMRKKGEEREIVCHLQGLRERLSQQVKGSREGCYTFEKNYNVGQSEDFIFTNELQRLQRQVKGSRKGSETFSNNY